VVVVNEEDWVRLAGGAQGGQAKNFGEYLATFPLSPEEWREIAPKRDGMRPMPFLDE
jgi:hypothetical protein